MQSLVGNAACVDTEGATVAEVLARLDEAYPGLRRRVYDESGQLRRFLNVYVNQEDIRFRDGEATPVHDGDEVSIVPAVAGG